jgi:predicted house-cleaning noncanonical NTP pyrophosphatase (MazG superfamily)
LDCPGKHAQLRLSQEKTYRIIAIKSDNELYKYHKSQKTEELIKVIYAATKTRGYTLKQLKAIRTEKAAKRGALDKKILLMEAI